MRIALAVLAICGCRQVFGLDDPSLAVDAAPDGPSVIVPKGTHDRYVVDQILIPTNNNESREYGLDLDNDGFVDNRLGEVLGTFSGMGLDVQKLNDISVRDGTLLELVDVQTTDQTFTSDPATGLTILIGAMPVPAPCNSGETVTCTGANPAVCTGCGHHLEPQGGSFEVANDPPALVGTIDASVFRSGSGTAHIALALFSNPIELDLIGARVAASNMSVTSLPSLIIAGALPPAAVTTQLIPGIQAGVSMLVTRDCTMPTAPPGCGCADGTEGKTLIGLFDASPADCTITDDEVAKNSLVMSLIAPDVTIDGVAALSLGVKVSAERATF